MKKINLLFGCLAAILFSGCQAIGDIFQAGVWVGIIAVVIVIAIIIWVISLFRGGKS
jgi:hypothetical protein